MLDLGSGTHKLVVFGGMLCVCNDLKILKILGKELIDEVELYRDIKEEDESIKMACASGILLL